MRTFGRRQFLRTAAGTALGLAAGRIRAAQPSRRERLNVLLLLSDDQRFDTIHELGNDQIRTPNLDRLARSGTTLTHTFVEIPICTPSRAALLTGRSGFHNGVKFFGEKIDASLPTLPTIMRQAGYTTFFTGKWHNDGRPGQRGFTEVRRAFPNGMGSHRMTYNEGGRKIEGFSSELFADAAVDFLKKPPADPFFMYVAFTAPHDPRTPPERFKAMYDPAAIQLPRNYMPEHPFDNGELKVRDEQLLPWPRTREAVQREIALYYAMITHLDEQIGRILAALDASGQADRTLVVFAGDNGLALGRHGLLGKQSMYEHSVRVPLMFRGPGIAAGRRADQLCYLYDLLPTICGLTGARAPEKIEGKSLAGVLGGRPEAVRPSVFGAYRDVQRMVRTDRWKLIEYPKIRKRQLFAIREDPWELNDLSAAGGARDEVENLRSELVRWQRAVGDTISV